MMPVLTVTPVTAHDSGVLLAVTVALSVTTFVALGMVIAQHRRTSRSFFALGGLGAASVGVFALTIGLGAALVASRPQSASAVVPLVITSYALENYQLQTLASK